MRWEFLSDFLSAVYNQGKKIALALKDIFAILLLNAKKTAFFLLELYKTGNIKIKIGLLAIALLILVLFVMLIVLIFSSLFRRRKPAGEENLLMLEIEKIQKMKKTPKEKLLLLSKTGKNFFKEYLKLNSDLTYSEIAEKLRDKKKESLANFCEQVSYHLYSQEELKKEELDKLIRSLKNIIKTGKAIRSRTNKLIPVSLRHRGIKQKKKQKEKEKVKTRGRRKKRK